MRGPDVGRVVAQPAKHATSDAAEDEEGSAPISIATTAEQDQLMGADRNAEQDQLEGAFFAEQGSNSQIAGQQFLGG